MNLASILKGPSAAHLLGADHLGRDLLSRLIHGARISLLVGFRRDYPERRRGGADRGTSGFLGGKPDLVVQRFVDAWMSFPGLLLLLTVMSLADRGLAQLIVVLGIAGGIPASRVVRGAVLGVKENAYFQAAEVIGCSTWKTLVRHVAPNIAAPTIVIFSINIGAVIITEASLSFLGFGLPLQIPSWGGMLSGKGASTWRWRRGWRSGPVSA